MANTSASQLGVGLSEILEYGNSTGSVNLYMAHGGTNFGWWAGAARTNFVVQSFLAVGLATFYVHR